jgi:hypothetical protein
MKPIITLIICAVALLLLIGTTIEFKPFKIVFDKPLTAIGWLLIVIGIAFISVQSERKGYDKAINEISEGEVYKPE